MTDPTARVLEFLGALDSAVPDLVTGLYLTGSTALGDVRPGSDLDMLVILATEPSPAQVEALAAMHQAMRQRPYLDATYLSAAQFETLPMDGTLAVPQAIDGVFHADEPAFELNPVVWVELARYGIAVRGPEPAELGIDVDEAELRAWNKTNLRDYWTVLAAQGHTVVERHGAGTPVPAEMLSWAVLGAPRLHYTIATGDVTSKTGAGAYALRLWPAYTELIERALAVRRGEDVTVTTDDLAQAADLIDTVIAEALELEL